MISLDARFIITMEKSDIINHGRIIIENDRIKAIGKANQIDLDSYDITHSFGNINKGIILPGLINTHTHSIQSVFRGIADDQQLLDWLRSYVLPSEGLLTAEQIYWAALLGYSEMVSKGTTTCSDFLSVKHTSLGFKAAINSGIRANIGKVLMDRKLGGDDELVEETGKQLEETEQLIQEFHGAEDGRINYSITPRFVPSCSEELLIGCSELLRKYPTITLQSHVAENKRECELVKELTGQEYVSYLSSVGLLTNRTILAHGIWLTDADKKLLSTSGTSISHNPSSNSKLASGICNVVSLLSEGIMVSLGTDGAPCNNNYDLFLEMRLASFLAKLKTEDETALPARKIVQMATIDGAKTLGMSDEIGSLKEGKKADIILLDSNSLHWLPLYNPYSFVVYSASGNDVRYVWVDGKLLVDDFTPKRWPSEGNSKIAEIKASIITNLRKNN
ncbi:MAG: amidohydrolase family protein [Candidatus Kariarchaeaceae archaeon]